MRSVISGSVISTFVWTRVRRPGRGTRDSILRNRMVGPNQNRIVSWFFVHDLENHGKLVLEEGAKSYYVLADRPDAAGIKSPQAAACGQPELFGVSLDWGTLGPLHGTIWSAENALSPMGLTLVDVTGITAPHPTQPPWSLAPFNQDVST